ncbi:MAG: hypothetical protein HY043_03410 [Verrucomicrobia bacterium]|nr:hypothetical protein [Verrucomicrobiota bacterium]
MKLSAHTSEPAIGCHSKVRGVDFPRSLIVGGILVVALSVGSTLLLLPLEKHGDVTISLSHEANDSDRIVFEVHNPRNKSIRLVTLDSLARTGTNWIFVGHLPLDSTNITTKSFRLEARLPDGRRDWKVRLCYMPEITGIKLLNLRLKQAWESRSIATGLRIIKGWDRVRYAYSEELHQ